MKGRAFWMLTAVPADRVVDARYGSPRLDERNPYERFPERDNWTEWEIREREDGSRYKVTRWASRWGGSFAYGEWTYQGEQVSPALVKVTS